MRPELIAALVLASPVCTAGEAVLYEDFQDGTADGWRAFGAGSLSVTTYEGNASLRMRGEQVAVTQAALKGASRVRIGASFAADGLRNDDECVGEATLDDGNTWFEVIRVQDGQDDSITLHTGATSRDAAPDAQRVWFRARVSGDSERSVCWLDNVYVVAETPATVPTRRRTALTREFLVGEQPLAAPVRMHEFTMPAAAAEPEHRFSGTLTLVQTESAGKFRAVHDYWNRAAEIGDPIRHLPEFSFEFVQRGHDIIPLQRGVLRREHPYWEIILQPGLAWNEADDAGMTRASLPFALQERAANCTHNGVLSWLFDGEGNVSRVAYQVSSETCGYFKADLWGVVDAEYRMAEHGDRAAGHFQRLDDHRRARLPVKPIEQLAEDYPGIDALGLGIDDGIHPDDMTVFGFVVDGTHYRSDCFTRAGPHPYCDSLPLPSYSTAKSIFGGVATMRLEKLHPGTSQAAIASLIPECGEKKWGAVTIEHALDMATGNYRSKAFDADEAAPEHVRFIFSDDHREKLDIACNQFPHKSDPGKQFVYRTSDTYLVGVALEEVLAKHDGGDDLYESALVEPIWNKLGLSPLLDDSKRTYDDTAQAFTGYGLTYEADDIVRIADWLYNKGAVIDADVVLDNAMLDAGLQRAPDDRGLPVGLPNVIYNNSFWGFDAGPSLGCSESVWVPYMAGVSGINVVMFPNGVIYYYFSDGYVFRWQSAREAAHTIRRLCE